MKKGKIIAVFISGLLLLGGCSLVENDLDKLEGTWSDGEGNGVVFYAPNESGDTSGDAEMITNGNAQKMCIRDRSTCSGNERLCFKPDGI